MATVTLARTRASAIPKLEYTVTQEEIQTGIHPETGENVNRVVKTRHTSVDALNPEAALQLSGATHRWSRWQERKKRLSSQFDPRYLWQRVVVMDNKGTRHIIRAL
jgi:hypothetical protein